MRCGVVLLQDIGDNWESTLELLRAAQNVAHASRPGYWNDLDITTVGQGGQTYTESAHPSPPPTSCAPLPCSTPPHRSRSSMSARTSRYVSQFQAWSVLSAPLILGLDVRSMTPQYLQLLTHTEALRINQDPLGEAGNLIRRSVDGSYEVWAKALWTNASTAETESLSTRHTDTARSRRARDALSGGRLSGRYRVQEAVESSSTAVELPVSNFHPWRYHAVWMLNRASYAQNLTLDFYSDLFDNFMSAHSRRALPCWRRLYLTDPTSFNDLPLTTTLLLLCDVRCPHAPPPPNATIRDAWNGKELGEFERTYTATNVPPHGSVLLTVRLVGEQ